MTVKATHAAAAAATRIAHQPFFRLDPYAAADRIAFSRDDIHYTIDRTGVSVKMKLEKSGLPLSFALPARAFDGIAARAFEREDGRQIVSLEIHHQDEAMCIPVLVAGDLDDIAADWHSWSRLMKLPMLIVGEDGMAQPVRKLLGMVMNEDPIERRKRFTSPKHRPWFLRRRKIGIVSEIRKLAPSELIARN